MPRRKFHRLRIFDLSGREDTVEETFAKSLHGMLDPRILHQVHADAEHAHRSAALARSPKPQAPSTRETPSSKHQTPRPTLELGIWSRHRGIGAWSLGF